MSETKLGALRKSSMAILLASLLGVAVYYASFGGDQIPIFPKPAYAFVWSQGNTPQAFEDYENATLVAHNLGMYIGLANGTTIHCGSILGYIHNRGESCVEFPEYHGSIEALINSITVQLTNFGILTGITGTNSFVNITTGGPGAENGPITNMTVFENKTISSTLVTSTTTDMGSYMVREGPGIHEATSTPGYWPDASKLVTSGPAWSISAFRLLEYLEGSGSATIRFDAVYSVHMNYTISFPDNRTETGAKDLVWTGTMGTIEFSYDESRILSVKYDIWQVRLILLVQESE